MKKLRSEADEVIQKFGLDSSCGFYLYCATKLDMDFKKP